MVILDRNRKDLVLPKSLGNFVTEGGGGGVTPEEAAEIASAVTSEALEEYSIELEVELEEIRDAISGNTDTLLDLAEIAAMSIADRVALFYEVFEKASNGEKIYIKGLVQEETIRTAILPLVSYRPETNPVLHQGGNLYFAAKGDTDNVYFHIGLTSEGQIDPTSGNIIKRNIYNLPTASAEVKGGVRIGSGLTMTQDTLSVDTTGLVTDGDLAPFIVQQSANTQNIASLSAATEAISESLGNYATTATTDELATAISGVSESLTNYATTATTDALSAVTSALSETILTLSGGTPTIYSAGTDYGWCVVYSYRKVSNLTNGQRKDVYTEIKNYSSNSGGGKLIFLLETPLSSGNWNYIYTLSNFNTTEATFVCFLGEEYKYFTLKSAGTRSSGTKPITYSAGSGVSISDRVVSLNIGEGLAFSGDTLVVSGGTGGGPAVYIVNLLTEQERIALYNELMAYRYIQSYMGVQSGFPASDYAFYYWAGDDNSDEFNNDFRGFIPLQLAALHPDDYGGAAFFSGMVLSRNGGGLIRTIKYIITSDGSVDMARGTNNWDPHPEAAYIYVDSDGTFRNDLWSLGNISNGDIIYRLNVRYNNNGNYSLGPVTEYRKNTEEVATDDWRDVYYFSTVISINGTTYKGTWRLVDYGDWEGQGPYPATSWTTI